MTLTLAVPSHISSNIKPLNSHFDVLCKRFNFIFVLLYCFIEGRISNLAYAFHMLTQKMYFIIKIHPGRQDGSVSLQPLTVAAQFPSPPITDICITLGAAYTQWFAFWVYYSNLAIEIVNRNIDFEWNTRTLRSRTPTPWHRLFYWEVFR